MWAFKYSNKEKLLNKIQGNVSSEDMVAIRRGINIVTP